MMVIEVVAEIVVEVEVEVEARLQIQAMNPLHWLAKIHRHAPKLLVPDEFVLDF